MYTNSAIKAHDLPSNITKQELANQQEKKAISAYKNPIQLDKNSLKLERDSINKNVYYLSFDYTCERETYGRVYLNSKFSEVVNNNGWYFTPSPQFENIKINFTIPKGKGKFTEKGVFIDMDYFLNNKVYDVNYIDLILELYVFEESTRNIEMILETFCRLKQNKDSEWDIKVISQKITVKGSPWYQIENIFGLLGQEKLCEICYDNERNTFFLPCKHSYACKDCAIMLRIKGNGCPICRQRKIIFINLI